MKREHIALSAIVVAALVFTGIHPNDRPTWFLEIFPVLIGFAILIPTYNRFGLTPLLYRLIFFHMLILILGGYYTYAKVPVGFWIRDVFGLERNPYDRIGHFIQGFVPAILAREILIRNKVVTSKGWLFFIVTSICLAFSACYEFIEWASAIIGGGSAEKFLGTQGDIWDTQWDMFMALLGALSAQLLLMKMHDKEIAQTLKEG